LLHAAFAYAILVIQHIAELLLFRLVQQLCYPYFAANSIS